MQKSQKGCVGISHALSLGSAVVGAPHAEQTSLSAWKSLTPKQWSQRWGRRGPWAERGNGTSPRPLMTRGLLNSW